MLPFPSLRGLADSGATIVQSWKAPCQPWSALPGGLRSSAEAKLIKGYVRLEQDKGKEAEQFGKVGVCSSNLQRKGRRDAMPVVLEARRWQKPSNRQWQGLKALCCYTALCSKLSVPPKLSGGKEWVGGVFCF